MGKLFLGLVAASVSFGIQAQGAEKGTADAKAAKQSHAHPHSTKEHTCAKCKKAEKNCKCEEKGGHDGHDHDETEKETK